MPEFLIEHLGAEKKKKRYAQIGRNLIFSDQQVTTSSKQDQSLGLNQPGSRSKSN